MPAGVVASVYIGRESKVMPKLQERVNAEQFTIGTTATAETIRNAGLRAIDASKRLMTSTVKEQSVEPGRISYVIKGPGGLVTQMSIIVSWQDTTNGHRNVTLKVGKYLTTRQTVIFIPVTPRRAPALGSLRRFSEVLRSTLEDTP
jgi:hypothetical protein